MPQGSFLNFDEDYIEFYFIVNHAKWKNIDLKSKNLAFVWFTSIGKDSQKSRIPIILVESNQKNEETTEIKIRASIKDNFLNLFSCDSKCLGFTIQYTDDKRNNWSSNYVMQIPNVDVLHGWKSLMIFESYLPQDIGGFQLVQLFQKKFRIKKFIAPTEKDLLNKLK